MIPYDEFGGGPSTKVLLLLIESKYLFPFHCLTSMLPMHLSQKIAFLLNVITGISLDGSRHFVNFC